MAVHAPTARVHPSAFAVAPPASSARSRAHATSTLGFDRIVAILGSIFVGGLFLDGWAHINRPSLETFFTPWHGVFYAGYFALLAALAGGVARNHARGFSWWHAVPAGYELSALGAGLFALGGVADMIWHIVFGIEVDIEALLSPTHLLLASAIALLVTGPVRAAWRRGPATAGANWASQLPMLLGLTALLSVLTFFTQYAAPLASAAPAMSFQPTVTDLARLHPGASNSVDLYQSASLGGILVQSALLAGFVLIALKRGPLPVGSLTLMIGVNAVLMVGMHQKYVAELELPLLVNAVLVGIGAELLRVRVRPTLDNVAGVRLFATAIPMFVYAAYLLTLGATQGLWWSINLWTGAVFLAGVAGWLTAFAFTAQSQQAIDTSTTGA